MIAPALLYGTASSHAPTGFFFFLGIVGLLLVVSALRRNRSGSRPTFTIGGKPPTNPTDVRVIDGDALSRQVQAIMAKGSVQKLAFDVMRGNSTALTDMLATIQGSQTFGDDSPFAVIMQVKRALRTNQLDSVRHLLSDRLYERWNVTPPPAAAPTTQLVMTTTQATGADPNRLVVRIGGGINAVGVEAEEWHLIRGSASSTPTDPSSSSTPSSPSAPSTPAVPSSACPFCGAQLDAGATRCRYCGMDTTMALSETPSISPTPTVPAPTPTVPATPLTPSSAPTWIVDDVTAFNQMAA